MFDRQRARQKAYVFLFGLRRFGRLGPMGLAYTGLQMWRRLFPQQKQAVRMRAGQAAQNVRKSRARPR